MKENDLLIEKKIILNEPMKNHTSFKIGGNADFYIKVSNVNELQLAINYAKTKNLEITIIGNGTNILVLDKGVRGLVIKIDLQDLIIEKQEKNAIVTVGAGYKVMALANKLMQQGLTGFEELSGIPGTIGGAVYMNAGAYGKEIKDINISTEYMDLNNKINTISNKEQIFKYRSSVFQKNDYIILNSTLRFNYGNCKEIQDKMNNYFESRKISQPIDKPSAGSTFKKKEGIIVSKLIDECGLKGFQIGGAKVSEKHAGFIINDGNASAQNVLDLIQYVKRKIYDKYGVEIQEEIRIIGEK